MRGMPVSGYAHPEPETESGVHTVRSIRNMTSRIHKKAPWHGGQEAKYPNVKSFDSGTIPNGTQDLIILFAHNKFRVHRSSR